MAAKSYGHADELAGRRAAPQTEDAPVRAGQGVGYPARRPTCGGGRSEQQGGGEGGCAGESATTLADLGYPDAVDPEPATARELWLPTCTDPYGDLDRPAACLELDRERLDTAESFTAASMRR